MLEPGEWIDLRVDDFKGAYHQLRLDDSFHKYVCVQLCGLLVAYQVPVFGMLSSCKAMCHAGQWAVQHCAAPVQGLQAGIYIDDATTLDKVTQEGQARHDQVTQGVQRLGFVHCLEKRQQGSRVNDLGYVLDGVDQTISVQEGKVQELRAPEAGNMKTLCNKSKILRCFVFPRGPKAIGLERCCQWSYFRESLNFVDHRKKPKDFS